jgi:tight adherence protein B
VFVGAVVTLWLTLRQRDDGPPPIEIPVEDRPDPDQHGFLTSLASRVRSLGDRFAERDTTTSMDASLDRAGVNLRPGEFVVVAATGIVVATLAGVTLAGVPGAIIFGGGAGLLPRTVLRALAERRQRAFGDQLEGTLQIIAGSLRAGYGLTQSIATVAEESPSPTAQEFDRVVVENRLGRSVEQSMEAMAARMSNEDLGWVVEAIKIQHEVGGDLAEVLDTVTSTIRDRNQIKRQVKALSAEGRISAFILLALPFVIAAFIAMITPDYLAELTTTTMGRIMLGVAALLMAAGAAWIRKIVRVDF